MRLIVRRFADFPARIPSALRVQVPSAQPEFQALRVLVLPAQPVPVRVRVLPEQVAAQRALAARVADSLAGAFLADNSPAAAHPADIAGTADMRELAFRVRAADSF